VGPHVSNTYSFAYKCWCLDNKVNLKAVSLNLIKKRATDNEIILIIIKLILGVSKETGLEINAETKVGM
jgi:hypothetical protein